MKKLTIATILLAVGAAVAFGSSLGVPWFSDGAPERADIPGKVPGFTGLVTLKSNVDYTLTCRITYFNQGGVKLGPWPPNNTFTIAPQSSLAFRPVQTDPDFSTQYPPSDSRAGTNPPDYGGQEGTQGVLVPNRPRSPNSTTPLLDQDGDPILNPWDENKPLIDVKKNGGIQISWDGAVTDVQGQYSGFLTAVDYTKIVSAYDTIPDNPGSLPIVTMSYAHLLPPGFSD